MKKFYLFFFVFFVSMANAQFEYRDGFYITKSNDTIVGQVLYRSNLLNYKACSFKQGNELKNFMPQDILGFGYKNGKYFTSTIVDSTFVEALVLGRLSLYRKINVYYVKKAGDKVYTLENKLLKDTVNGIERLRTDFKWKGILSVLTYDYMPNSNILINGVRFDEIDITKFVLRYNSCGNEKYIDFKEHKPWSKINIGLGAGITESWLSVKHPVNQYLYFTNMYQSLDASFGIVFDISLPRISEMFSIQSEFYYYKTNYNSSKDIFDPYKNHYETNIGFTSVSIPVSAKFTFHNLKVPLYTQLGLIYDNHLNVNTNLHSEIENENVVTLVTDKEAFKIRNYQFGAWAGIGAIKSFKKIDLSLNLRYYLMTNLSETDEIKVSPSRLSLSTILYFK